MKLYKDIEEGGLIPKGYGVAWRSYYAMRVRCYPIPINLVVRFSKHFYYWLAHGCWSSRWERELLNARMEGFTAGRNSKK